ncbi:MAG: family 20 glycosylhydrolase [Acidimicrobiaceae bacterium]|nr:family 20 glycosylhydrolase [Acidimicrobiaceae bacterium]
MNVIPRPHSVDLLPGEVIWTSPLRVMVDEDLGEAVSTFATDLAATVGWKVDRVFSELEADLRISSDSSQPPEGFTLRVGDGVVVSAADGAGLSYAFQFLRQLCPPTTFASGSHLDEWRIPALTVVDSPQYPWRGVHLDVARHFFSVEDVERLIDLLGLHRLNHLHLHLNDDQGWRVEVPSWPRLTEVGAWRRSSPIGHEREGRDDGVPHGGFYTREDIERLRARAALRWVTLVPEIDLPGHAQAVLAAYPEFAVTSEPLEVWTRWGISENVLNVEEATLDFAESVVRDVAALFPGSPFHIGGDECPTTQWESSAAARAIMAERHLQDPRELQGLFTRRLTHTLQQLGHEVLAWDEVLDAEVPDGTVIVAWRDVAKGVEAAERGLEVVMAPMQWVYFDWLNSASPAEPVAIAPAPAVSTLEHVYEFSVVPEEIPGPLEAKVRGAQAELWTEYITNRDHLDYMAFPRLCAFAEVVWGTAGSFDEFRSRLGEHLERLTALGVRYRPLDDAV